MEDVVSQDRVFTIEVLLALLQMYEEEWETYYLRMLLVSVSACMFLLVTCLGGMPLKTNKLIWRIKMLLQ